MLSHYNFSLFPFLLKRSHFTIYTSRSKSQIQKKGDTKSSPRKTLIHSQKEEKAMKQIKNEQKQTAKVSCFIFIKNAFSSRPTELENSFKAQQTFLLALNNAKNVALFLSKN